MEEVGRQQPLGLGAKEGPPLGIRTAWGWPDPGGGKDASDSARTDPMPETYQLTLDSAVPPRRILRRQPQDEFADLAADWWPASLVG